MNVIDLLGEALATKNWIKVEDAYKLLGGKDLFSVALENLEADDAKVLSSIVKKKRGRPKKVKTGDEIVSGNLVGKVLDSSQAEVDQRLLNAVHEGSGEETPSPDKFQMKKDGPKKRFEPFKKPTGPNLFDPKTVGRLEDPVVKVNDKVQPSPRRPATQNLEVIVFCEDCQKNVNIYPDKSREPYYCEYKKFGKQCPR